MSIDNEPFGIVHLKAEGGPVHPDDCDINNCSCCGTRYLNMLAAYNKFYGIKDASPS